MKKILVLIDFSKASENALHYAAQYYEDVQSEFFLMHINDASSFTTDDLITAGNRSLYDSLISSTTKKLEQLCVSVRKQFPNKNHSFVELTDFDPFIDSINQAVKSKSIDLIIMGSNGVSDAKEALFGTNTINVVRHIKTPTLIIPETQCYKTPKHILIPIDNTDFTINLNLKSQLAQIALKDCHLHTLSIDLNDEDNIMAKFNNLLLIDQIEHHSVYDVPTHYAINSFIQTHNIDLLVLMVKEEFFIDRIFKGSVSTKVSREPIIPILVIH